MFSSISKATYGAARSSMMLNASRYQAAIQYSYYYRGVSSSDLLHRSASSLIGGSNNYHHHQYYNYSSKQRQSSHRFIVDIALFSSALYGAAAAASAARTNETPALCSNNSNSNDDEDFISKVKAKINSQSIAELSSSLPASMNMDELLSTIGSQAQLALNSGIPTNLSYGFFAGYLSGFALKKIGRAASLTFGVGFVILQTLAYQGYVDVNHDKLAKQIEGVLDRNGDGVVDGEDLRSVVDELRRVVGFGIEAGKEEDEDGRNDDQVKALAGGGGFGMGFLGGLRSG
ncbi:FUN14 family protein [Skeletonema marinoi]|uniref:FUN14 family protein n=1 Tax=Skeletonema marinoi TaxID=267567 RepID=A0AAD9DA93_9STRA|nr:FUN14 family protein [Skeletonema marinoi]